MRGRVCADMRVCACVTDMRAVRGNMRASARERSHACADTCARTCVYGRECATSVRMSGRECEQVRKQVSGKRGNGADEKSRDETVTSARAAATPTPLHENSRIDAAPRQTGEVRHWPRCRRHSRSHLRRPQMMTCVNNAAATSTVL